MGKFFKNKRLFFIKAAVAGLGISAIAVPFATGAQDAFAATGGKTASRAISWVKSKVGTGIDYDGCAGAQCVDLAKAYYAYLGNSAVRGNGADYVSNSKPDAWGRLKGAQPKKGDILVYTGGYGGYGHVAIYESDYSHYHQNWNGHSYVENVTYKYNGNFGINYWGVIRPDFPAEKTPAVTTVSVQGVSLNKASASMIPGQSLSLTATITPSNASNKKVSWTSSNRSVATVDANGKVVAIKTGTTDITVKTTDGGKTATARITVKAPTTGLAKVNGQWGYYTNGKLDTNHTGIAKSPYNGKWYYVKKGRLDSSYNGLAKSPKNGKWYYVQNGVVNYSYKGLGKSPKTGKWYYVNGVVDYTYTGLGKSPKTGKWYYVKKGVVDYTYTGLGKSPKNGRLYYVRKGVLDYSYNGMVKYNGKTYKVVKGLATPV